MSNRATYLRMLGYTVTIGMHVGNMMYMNRKMSGDLSLVPELKILATLQSRYFTCWTFFFQVLHAWIGLVCDYLILSNSKNKVYKLPKYLKGFKNTLFSAIVWPSTWIVFTVFWTLYNYDRGLIYPKFVDKVLSSTSNHIMHSAIVPVVLWEVFYQPRVEPRSHIRNLYHLIFELLLYFVVLSYTYIEHDIWIYPIFSKLYGTVYFPLLHMSIGILGLCFYYMQWVITDLFWSRPGTKKIT